jgi:hypothetical protein
MKKLLIVLSALVLAVGVAVPALSADKEATWGGEFTFGGITLFDENKKAFDFGNAYFDATIPVDDYNEVVFELGAGWGNAIADADVDLTAVPPEVVLSYGNFWTVGVAKLVTDVGEYAGLPVGLTNSAGYFGYDSRKFEVTGHGWERKYRPGIGAAPSTLFELDFGMATLGVDITWESGPGTQDYAALLLIPELGPASLEAGVFVKDNDDFDMAFGANVQAKGLMDMIDFAAGFGVDTKDVPDYAEWWYGVGAKVTYDMFGVGVSLNGDEAYTIDKLGIDGIAELGDDYGIEAGLGLNLDTDNPATNGESFAGFDVSAYYKPGVSKWVVGYLYCGDGSYTYGAPVAGDPAAAYDDRGGLYLKCDIDF